MAMNKQGEDGIIQPDSEAGKSIGFTSNKFTMSSYLWKRENTMWISAIHSVNPGKGDFSRLLKTLEKEGFSIIVPTCFPKMEAILKTKGFRFEKIWDAEIGEEIEIWTKKQKKVE